MKYPRAFILNEVGTNKELSKIYGVSERTIYRWKNKAKAETGERKARPRRPRARTLETFKGTRKELAKKYGVSERTVYRWLNKAKLQGKEVQRRKPAKYPGPGILNDKRTNKQLADNFGVSERTISRWKRKARLDALKDYPDKVNGMQNNTPPLEDVGEPWEVPEPEDVGEPWEVPEPEDVGEPWEVPEMSDRQFVALEDIANLLIDAEILEPDSLFFTIPEDMRAVYLNEYIQFQYDKDPFMFEDSPKVKGPDLKDPSKIVNVNIWGGDFEEWISQQIELNNL